MSSSPGKPKSRETNKLRVFLSYSSEQENIAEQVYMALTTSGHDVFFDRTDLPPGDEFDGAILNAIRSSDLFVFLISPESVADGKYTRTELRFARDTWPDPVGHILPVLAVETDFSAIPNYLKAVTILQPEGNLPAEVSAAVNDLAEGISPKDTIAGQVELIKETAQEMSRLRQQQTLAEIDNEWKREKQRYRVFKKDDEETTPTPTLALQIGLVFSALALIGYLSFTRTHSDFFGWFPVVVPLLMGAAGSLFTYLRARQYEKAEADYYERRRKASSNEGNDAERLLGDLTRR